MSQQIRKEDVKHTKLYGALVNKIRDVTQYQVAVQAKVSTKTLCEIKNGKFIKKIPTRAADVSARRLRGFVTSIARLALYLELDIEETLRELSIDPEWLGVRDAIQTAKRHQTENPVKTAPDQSDLDKDIYPLMRVVCESSYEGKLSFRDIICLLRVQETIARPLTAAAVVEILKLR